MTTSKALTVGAWLASLVWFAVATWVFMGFTPLSLMAWAMPSWMLFRATMRWWSRMGNPLGNSAYRRLTGLGVSLGVVVVGVLGWSISQPIMSTSQTALDFAMKGIAVLCVAVPPLVVTWIVFRSLKVPGEPS